MNSLKYIKTLSLVFLSAGILTSSTIFIDSVYAETQTLQRKDVTIINNMPLTVTPLAVVNNPNAYLNKNIVIKAKFDKFSTLGLDYKPAFRTSEDYISFLIQREDTDHNIPLSELKLFIKRDLAEKNIDLNTNDEIELKGLVFSNALGDAWIDVSDIKITKKVATEEEQGGEN